MLSARGLPPLPHTPPTPTHISIALLVNRFDVLWVDGKVGHADSKMTMDVYAQLQQRVKREQAWRSIGSATRRASSSTESSRRRQPTPERGFRPRK